MPLLAWGYMPVLYDLHTHTHFSDGILSPQALVSRAKQRQVDVLAITDHDNTAAIKAATAEARSNNIDLISGIEFSSQWQGRGVHLVGLNIDIDSEAMLEAVASQQARRQQRAETIASRLEKAGIAGALDGATALSNGETLGRPHFARYLVENGHVSNINQAFKRYLGAGKLGDVKNVWPEIETVVDWIDRAGGISVLAHPYKYKMTRTKLCKLVEHFRDCGGKAIEVVSGKQAVGQAENIVKIAELYGLASSIGSDFHVPDQPWQELGCSGYLPNNSKPVWELWQ